MATFREFLVNNNVAFVKQTASGNGLNFQNESGVQLASIILNDKTPAQDDILMWVKEHMDFNCSVRGNFISLTKVERGVSIASLFDEPEVKSRKKATA